MLITLALLPFLLSVTIAALLTVILLPVALLTARQSASFAVMTLAMLGLLWRGEAWKAAYLEAEAQLTRVQQLQPKIESTRRVASFAYDDLRLVSWFLRRPVVFPGDLFQPAQQAHPDAEGARL